MYTQVLVEAAHFSSKNNYFWVSCVMLEWQDHAYTCILYIGIPERAKTTCTGIRIY